MIQNRHYGERLNEAMLVLFNAPSMPKMDEDAVSKHYGVKKEHLLEALYQYASQWLHEEVKKQKGKKA